MPDRFFRFAPLLFLLLWSSGYSVASVALRDAGVLTTLTLRYGCVLLLLLPALAVVRPAWPKGRAWLHLAVVGATVQLGYFVLNWSALADGVGVGVSALVSTLQPVLAALVAPWFGGARPDRRLWTGLGIGCLGAAGVVLARLEVAAPGAWPFALAVGSVLSMTAGSLYEGRHGRSAHPLMAAFVQYLVGFLGAGLLAAGTEDLHVHWTPTFIAALAYLVVANSLIAISLLLAMFARGEVARVSALFFLVPPVAALVGIVVTGESLSAFGWAGMALAVVGVGIATRPRRVAARTG